MTGINILLVAEPAFKLFAVTSFIVCGVLIAKNKDSGFIVGLFGVSWLFATFDVILCGSITTVMINGAEMLTQLAFFSFAIGGALIFAGGFLIYYQLVEAAKKKAAAEIAAKKSKESGYNSVFRR